MDTESWKLNLVWNKKFYSCSHTHTLGSILWMPNCFQLHVYKHNENGFQTPYGIYYMPAQLDLYVFPRRNYFNHRFHSTSFYGNKLTKRDAKIRTTRTRDGKTFDRPFLSWILKRNIARLQVKHEIFHTTLCCTFSFDTGNSRENLKHMISSSFFHE